MVLKINNLHFEKLMFMKKHVKMTQNYAVVQFQIILKLRSKYLNGDLQQKVIHNAQAQID